MNLADLARIVGVSPSTVSRALLNRPGISLPLKEKIRTLAQELCVRADPSRQAARKKRMRFRRDSGPQMFFLFE